PGELHEPLLATAQVAGAFVAECAQAELLQDLASRRQLANRCLALGLPQPKDAAPEGFPRFVPVCQHHVLEHREAAPLARRLECPDQAEARDAVRWKT